MLTRDYTLLSNREELTHRYSTISITQNFESMSTPQEIIDASTRTVLYRTPADLLLSLQNAIANNVVVVFSKTWCGYSKRAKALLTAEYPDVKPVIFESVSLSQRVHILTSSYRLDERDDGDKFQDYLEEKYNQRSVPNVFISAYWIPDCSAITLLKHCACTVSDQKHIGGESSLF